MGSRASRPPPAGLPDRIARAWAVLMKRLGHTRYVAQGGDWGTAISAALARQAPEGLLAIHVNFAQMVPLEVLGHIRNGDPAPADPRPRNSALTDRSPSRPITAVRRHPGHLSPDDRLQPGRHPVGLAAWLLDHDTTSYEHLARCLPASPSAPSPATTCSTTPRSIGSPTPRRPRPGCTGNKAELGNFYAAADLSLPTAVTVFPEEYVQAPRSWTEQAYHNLIYFNDADRGGHFAAWEQPQLFSAELRAAFRSLR